MSQSEYIDQVGTTVAAAIDDAFPSRRQGALAAGIPVATLDRKLRTPGAFTLDEMARLASATGRSVAELLPRKVAA